MSLGLGVLLNGRVLKLFITPNFEILSIIASLLSLYISTCDSSSETSISILMNRLLSPLLIDLIVPVAGEV